MILKFSRLLKLVKKFLYNDYLGFRVDGQNLNFQMGGLGKFKFLDGILVNQWLMRFDIFWINQFLILVIYLRNVCVRTGCKIYLVKEGDF